jgi:hypothetical protein
VTLDLLQYGLGALSGSLVGFTLGLVGGGGSILAVPLMVYLVGVRNPHIAIGALDRQSDDFVEAPHFEVHSINYGAAAAAFLTARQGWSRHLVSCPWGLASRPPGACKEFRHLFERWQERCASTRAQRIMK